jgi:hypothetical protein
MAGALQRAQGRKTVIWLTRYFPIEVIGDENSPINTDSRFPASASIDYQRTVNLLNAAQISIFPLQIEGPEQISPIQLEGSEHFLRQRHLHTICRRWDAGTRKDRGRSHGGGAHGTKPYRLSAHFIASIPFNRGVNAVTHTDYEGVGVKPDVPVPAKEALVTAHILALRGVLARTTGEPERKAELEKWIGELEAKLKSGNMEE